MNYEIPSTGYISVYRSLFNHWLWEKRKLSKWEAWLWILAYANYEEKTWVCNGELVQIMRGDLIVTRKKLMDVFGWKEHEIRQFLHLLKKDQQVVTKTTKNYTKISICKYDTYQTLSPTKRPQNAHKTPQHKEVIITPISPLNGDREKTNSLGALPHPDKKNITKEECIAIIQIPYKERTIAQNVQVYNFTITHPEFDSDKFKPVGRDS